ncbi:MAG: DUF4340 domain-containing protein [Clostridia bacterium]|nr:DUF4340 domain-containing protein [Clostridia bacterium]
MNKKTKIGFIIGIVALVLIVALILLVFLLPSGSGDGDDFVAKEFNSLEATVDQAGLRTVSVPVDEKGQAKENIIGELVDMLPKDLEEIKVENSKGNYVFKCSTNADGATTYTLVGFEDYDLNDTNASMMGTAISCLSMAGVADATGENKADFGLDNPKVTASAKFTDGSYVKLYIGDDAPGGAYTHVMLEGCDSVFTVNKTDIEALTLDLNDMFNALIRSEYSTVSDEDFTYITLDGTHLAEEVTIEHAPDGSLNGYYVMTSHNDKIVNSTIGSEIVGSIKSISGEGVAFANPDADTLKELGLDKPYATVKAQYEYTDAEGNDCELYVSMLCSEPDYEGKVYLMDEDGKLVYIFASEKLRWSDVTMESLRSEYAFAPSYSAIKGMTVSNGDESYSFTVETVVTESVDENGNDTSVSEVSVKYGDKEIEEGYFRTLFEDLAMIPSRGAADESDKNGNEIVTVTYEYNTGREPDTVTYFATDSQKVLPQYDGEIDCYIYKADIDGVMDNAKALSEGKEITSVRG